MINIKENLFDLSEEQELKSKQMYSGKVTGTKTFMANIHDIRYELLKNESHRLSESVRSESHKKISNLVSIINSKNTLSEIEYKEILSEIDLIGEPVISSKLREMVNKLTII
jgi:hypothetical protein